MDAQHGRAAREDAMLNPRGAIESACRELSSLKFGSFVAFFVQCK